MNATLREVEISHLQQQELCRTCLRPQDELISLETSFVPHLLEAKTHLECLRACTQCEIPLGEVISNGGGFHYPTRICIRCSKALEVSYHFITLARESEQRLQEHARQALMGRKDEPDGEYTKMDFDDMEECGGRGTLGASIAQVPEPSSSRFRGPSYVIESDKALEYSFEDVIRVQTSQEMSVDMEEINCPASPLGPDFTPQLLTNPIIEEPEERDIHYGVQNCDDLLVQETGDLESIASEDLLNAQQQHTPQIEEPTSEEEELACAVLDPPSVQIELYTPTHQPVLMHPTSSTTSAITPLDAATSPLMSRQINESSKSKSLIWTAFLDNGSGEGDI